MEQQTLKGRMLVWLMAAIVAGILVFSLATGLPKQGVEFIVMPLVGVAFCLASAIYLAGQRAAFLFLGVTVVLSWIAEELGVRTGFIFGDYYYTPLLGPKLGSVPLVIPLYWFMIVYISYILANLMSEGTPVASPRLTPVRILLRSLLTGLLATNYDLSFDPYMSQVVKAWIWEHPNPNSSFFNVPFHNFYGWLVTAFLIVALIRFGRSRMKELPSLGPLTAFTTLAPVLFYTSWWIAHWKDGYPPQVRVVAFISLGIPAVAAFLRWWSHTRDEQAIAVGLET